MPVRDQIEYILPGPIGGVNRRAYQTEIPDDNFLMLKNVEVSEALGAFVTRKGTNVFNVALIDGGADGPIRGGLRFYYGSTFKGMIVATGTKLWRDALGSFSLILAGFTLNQEWFFSVFDDIVYAVNGADAVQRYDPSAASIRPAGFPAPVSAPSVASNPVGALTGKRRWKVTFVYDTNTAHESSASPQSAELDLLNQSADLTAIPLGGTGCTSREVYRTKAGGTTFFFVAVIPDNVTTTYNDIILDSALGLEQAPTDNGLPPTGAEKIVNWRGRCVMAKGKRVYFSAINNTEKSPDGSVSLHGAGVEIFPSTHFIDVGDDNSNVTQIAVIDDLLVVFKEDQIWNISGDSGQDIRAWKAQSTTGCMSPRSLVDMQGLLFFLGRSEGTPMVYSYNGSKADPVSLAIEPYLMDNVHALGDVITQPIQPCATRYRGRYMLAYRNAVSLAYEVAELDLRPPNARWVFDDKIDASVFIPWFGRGDAGEMYFGLATEARVLRLDVAQTEYNGGVPIPVVATVETKWLNLGAPYQQKQVRYIEIYCKVGEQPGPCDPSPGDTLLTVARSYDFGTAEITNGCLNYNVTTAAKITAAAQLLKIRITCLGGDAATPERGYLVKLKMTMTAPLEIHRVVIHAIPEEAWKRHHQTT